MNPRSSRGLASKLSTALALACAVLLGAAHAFEPPLTVGPEDELLKDGEPYRGFGVNYFDAFLRRLQDPQDDSYRAGFETLAAHGIPFVRFNAGGFWPVDWELYLEDKERYFALMDDVVEAAETHGVGLIPSLFWWYAAVPDMVGEPMSAWGDRESETHAFMRTYVEEVVTRYRDSPAIWAWEFGNEYNLQADLPNAEEHRPPIWPNLGTPEERGPDDDLTHEMLVTAAKAFAEEVREHDPARPITTGHATPRAAAEHLRRGEGWTPDSEEEYRRNLIEMAPDPHGIVSMRLYPHQLDKRFGRDDVTHEELLQVTLEAASDAGKAVFVGEFGARAAEGLTALEARETNKAMLNALKETGVPLAAIWVFDFDAQEDEGWNITPDNDRAYLLDLLEEANQRLGD